jgi:hypothetical protein
MMSGDAAGAEGCCGGDLMMSGTLRAGLFEISLVTGSVEQVVFPQHTVLLPVNDETDEDLACGL